MNPTKPVPIALAVLLTLACGGRLEDTAASGGNPNNDGTGSTSANGQQGGASADGGTRSGFFGLGGTLPPSGGNPGAGGAPIGGVAAAGDTHAGGKSGSGGTATGGDTLVALTGGLETPDGFYENGDFHGAIWVVSDSSLNRRKGFEHSTCTLAVNEMCVTGKAAQVALAVDGVNYDYSEFWGIDLGWNLNQAPAVAGGAVGPELRADFSDVASLTVNLEGAAGLNMLVVLQTRNGGQATSYCATLPTSGMPQTLELNTLRTNCSQSGGTNFDPSTMQPTFVALAVVTSTSRAYPINFCVTELKFNSAGDGG